MEGLGHWCDLNWHAAAVSGEDQEVGGGNSASDQDPIIVALVSSLKDMSIKCGTGTDMDQIRASKEQPISCVIQPPDGQ